MVKVYIAAPFPTRDDAIRVMHMLERQLIEVTSRWLKAPDTLSAEHALKDLADVARADVLLALNPEGWTDKGTGGRHVELGYALALGMPIVLVGERSNIFHELPTVKVCDDSEDLAKVVKNVAWVNQPLLNVPAERALALVYDEFCRATAAKGPMHSPHEGKSVIEEELDELWDHVKANTGRSPAAIKEAMQVAAMGLRYMVDLSTPEA